MTEQFLFDNLLKDYFSRRKIINLNELLALCDKVKGLDELDREDIVMLLSDSEEKGPVFWYWPDLVIYAPGTKDEDLYVIANNYYGDIIFNDFFRDIHRVNLETLEVEKEPIFGEVNYSGNVFDSLTPFQKMVIDQILANPYDTLDEKVTAIAELLDIRKELVCSYLVKVNYCTKEDYDLLKDVLDEDLEKENSTVREKVTDLLNKYNKEKTSKINIFEFEDKDDMTDKWWIDHFDDGDIDFSQFTEHEQKDPFNNPNGQKYYSFMISGGLNGSGEWDDYLEDIRKVFIELQNKLDLDPVLYELETDIADDVWTGKMFLYENASEDKLNESLIETIVMKNPMDKRKKIKVPDEIELALESSEFKKWFDICKKYYNERGVQRTYDPRERYYGLYFTFKTPPYFATREDLTKFVKEFGVDNLDSLSTGDKHGYGHSEFELHKKLGNVDMVLCFSSGFRIYSIKLHLPEETDDAVIESKDSDLQEGFKKIWVPEVGDLVRVKDFKINPDNFDTWYDREEKKEKAKYRGQEGTIFHISLREPEVKFKDGTIVRFHERELEFIGPDPFDLDVIESLQEDADHDLLNHLNSRISGDIWTAPYMAFDYGAYLENKDEVDEHCKKEHIRELGLFEMYGKKVIVFNVVWYSSKGTELEHIMKNENCVNVGRCSDLLNKARAKYISDSAEDDINVIESVNEDIIIKPGSTVLEQKYKEFDTRKEAVDFIIAEEGFGEMQIRYIPKTKKYRVVWEEAKSLDEDYKERSNYDSKAIDLAKRVNNACNLSEDDYQLLIHDLNNLRGDEWLSVVESSKVEDLIADFKAFISTDLEEDIEKHDTLNPKLWNEDHTIKPEVEEKIMEIVNDFLDGLAEDGIKFNLKDVKLVGSNCSYNYTKDSDLDVHLVAETDSLKCPDNLYPLLYSAYRSIWNKNHDISFYGIPVELYVETDDTVVDTDTEPLQEGVNKLDVTTPYMLRNDGVLLGCGDVHPYIKMSSKASFKTNLHTLMDVHPDFLNWYYDNTKSQETKELITEFQELAQKGESSELEELFNLLNDMTNQEFCRVRTSNYKVKYGGDNGEIYFRISSTGFNWYDLIWNVVNKFSNQLKKVSVLKDAQTFGGKEFDYYHIKGEPVNHMPVETFLTASGNPVIERLDEAKDSAVKSNGVYSVLHHKWIKEPVQSDIPDLDREAFDKLFNEWEDKYFDLMGEADNLSEAYNQDADKRYYVKPQNIYCSSKKDILRILIRLKDTDCTIYTLKNLKDNKYVSQLGPNDVIYYYHDGKLYDKNKVKVMDYDLVIKNEENRKRFINPDNVPDDTFDQVYSDRLTEFLKEDEEETELDKLAENLERLLDDHDVWSESLIDIMPTLEAVDINAENARELQKIKDILDANDITYRDISGGVGYFGVRVKPNGVLDVIEDLEKKVPTSDDINKFIEQLYDLRKTSIASEGEYGLGNLVFKEFRNLGYLDRLKDYKGELRSKELSLENLK